MTAHDTTMTVECRTCPVRELHCGECMVPVLLDLTAPSLRVDHALDPQERAAVTRLVHAGLVDPETASRVRARLEPAAVSGATRPEGGRAVG
jgi:hypothetical protein